MRIRSHLRIFKPLVSSDAQRPLVTPDDDSLNANQVDSLKSDISSKSDTPSKSDTSSKSDTPLQFTATEYYEIGKQELNQALTPRSLSAATLAMAQAAFEFANNGQLDQAANVWTELREYMEKQAIKNWQQHINALKAQRPFENQNQGDNCHSKRRPEATVSEKFKIPRPPSEKRPLKSTPRP